MTGPLWDLVLFVAVIGAFWAVAMFDLHIDKQLKHQNEEEKR